MILLLILICIAAIAVYKLLPVFAGGHQEFTDIILENVSLSGFNKSGELQLFWLVLTIGAVLLIAGLFFMLHSSNHVSENRLQGKFPIYTCILIFPFLAYLIVFGKFSIPLFAGLIIFILSQIFRPKITGQVLMLYLLSYYGIMSILTIAVQFTDRAMLSSNVIYGLTLLLGSILLIISYLYDTKGTHIINKAHIAKTNNNSSHVFLTRTLLVLQCLPPGLITIWLVDDYLYQGQMIEVPYATGYVAFFLLFMLVTFALVLWHAVKNWNYALSPDTYGQSIDNKYTNIKNTHSKYLNNKHTSDISSVNNYLTNFITPIIIFAYHSFSAAPMYAQPDQHHHGEQMIPWNQIFEYGQTLYEEYTPVSGLFPYVNGFIQHILLDGTITDYSPAVSITMVIFCVITMYLVYKHVGGSYATLFAVFFTLPSYNRQYMVLPVLLLLTLPQLLDKKNRWLQVWIFSCFLSGLYYPLYGAGLLLGTFPLGIWQAITYVKSDTFKSDIKNIRFYIVWGILFIPILCSIPTLLNMLNHTLTYSSQTIMADGILLLGQQAPDYFLPYLTSADSLRQFLYLSLRFLLPIIGIWLFVYFLFYSVKQKNRRLTMILIAGTVSLLISYTYTLVRADTGKILSRTAMVLMAVAGMFLPIILLSYKRELQKKATTSIVIGACVALPMMLFMQISQTKNPDMWVYPDGESQLVMDDAAKLYSYYEVPETFVKSEDTGLSSRYQELLGKGFMVADQISYIEQYAAVIEKCETVSTVKPVTYMAMDGQGFYDYLGVPCSATGFIPAARSYEAQRAIWDVSKENLPVVFYLQPEYNYYIFRFMIDEGYVYVPEDQAFYPGELYAAISDYSDLDSTQDTTSASMALYRQYSPASDFQTHPAAFGESTDSLKAIFDENKTIRTSTDGSNAFPTVFNGMDYDCIYIDFTDEFMNSLKDKASTGAEGNTNIQQLTNGRLVISWEDTEGISYEGDMVSCAFQLSGEGKLLLPMGMNAGWLLSEKQDFTIAIYSSEDISQEPYISFCYKDIINNDANPSSNDACTTENLTDIMEDFALLQIDWKR